MIVRTASYSVNRRSENMDHQFSEGNNNNNNSSNNTPGQKRAHPRIPEKYGLRPRSVINRFHLERERGKSPKKDPSKAAKSRPPPLSKYRRKTANARERHRMREINDAFESLRKTLPDFCSRRAATTMTKITTLRLAVNYIRTLSHILQDGHPGDVSFIDSLHMDISFGETQFSRPTVSERNEFQCDTTTGIEESLGSPGLSCPASTISSRSSSPIRGSLSNAELHDLGTEDAYIFEDNLDAFDDIPALQEVDPFALLLSSEGDALPLET
ncbi:helix-loop-helix protein delilah-like [Macrobrachium rosenbergii]|uniref:helix-loop-helix protein delilah-like n=1 Tax=Macrobrachium rosenbergii TaxID=79674 RepID=UPI0034D41473